MPVSQVSITPGDVVIKAVNNKLLYVPAWHVGQVKSRVFQHHSLAESWCLLCQLSFAGSNADLAQSQSQRAWLG